MFVVLFLICMIIGLGMLVWLSPKNEIIQLSDVFLSWGLGVGVTSQLTFFSILPFQKLIPLFVCVLSALLVILSLILITKNNRLFVFRKPKLLEIVFVGILLVYGMQLCYESSSIPFGRYDGFSLWNYRAVSVFRGGEHWMAVFHNCIQGNHPWLLPMFIDWGWSLAGKEAISVPIMIAVVMSMATVGLLMSFLSEEIGWLKALLGGVFLLSIPFFLWHSISQYADIFVAYYLLAAFYCLKKMVSTDSLKYSILSGTFLALLAFTKDEGIMLCGLCLMATAIFLKPRVLLKKSFILPLCLVSVATLLCEVLMRTNILSYPQVTAVFFDTDISGFFSKVRIDKAVDFLWNDILLNADFGRLRLWVLLLLLGGFSRFGRFLVFIIIVSNMMYFMGYQLLDEGMVWRIDVTFDRLLFQLMPIMVWLLFYGLFFKTSSNKMDSVLLNGEK